MNVQVYILKSVVKSFQEMSLFEERWGRELEDKLIKMGEHGSSSYLKEII